MSKNLPAHQSANVEISQKPKISYFNPVIDILPGTILVHKYNSTALEYKNTYTYLELAVTIAERQATILEV